MIDDLIYCVALDKTIRIANNPEQGFQQASKIFQALRKMNSTQNHNTLI